MVHNGTVAARLKQARINAGYKTAKEFAEKNGIPQPTYALHEGGKRGISVSVAEQYATILGVTAQKILFGQPPAHDDRDNILLKNFHELTPEEQEALLLVAAAMAARNKRALGAGNDDQNKQRKAAS